MASSKKVVGKDDLRKLMKEHRTVGALKSKKIDSPLAKYNSLGQLLCAVCNSQVKNELLWNAHVQGRTHKENVIAIKSGKARKDDPIKLLNTLAGSKRKEPQASPVPEKKPKSILKNSKQTDIPSTVQQNRVPDDFFEDPKERIKKLNAELKASASTKSGISGAAELASSVPADFFDSETSGTSNEVDQTKDVNVPPVAGNDLPEGFFDDPKTDAKVRQVEYKNKMDEEWELFQKSMKEENVVSENILEEEDEKTIADRNLDEIDDQMSRWQKVDRLQKQKEKLAAEKKNKEEDVKMADEEESDLDEEDFEEFLDWRSKKAWT